MSKSRLQSVPTETDITVGALASKTALIVPLDWTPVHGYYAIQFKRLYLAWLDWTENANQQGPLIFGVCSHATIAVSEIKEYLELDGPESPGLDVDLKVLASTRFIRVLGLLTGERASDAHPTLDFDRQPVEVGLNFPDDDHCRLAYWIYNMDSAAITTGTTVRCVGELLIRWLG